MANPFDGRRTDAGPRHLVVGDTRAFGNGDRMAVLTRTSRSYLEDYRDALNAARSRQDVEWFITPEGELKIGWTREASARHDRIARDRDRTERARNLRNHLDSYQRGGDEA